MYALLLAAVLNGDPGPTPSRPASWYVSCLADDDFLVREHAEVCLRKMGCKAFREVRAGRKSPDPEVAARCERLYRDIPADRLHPYNAAIDKMGRLPQLDGFWYDRATRCYNYAVDEWTRAVHDYCVQYISHRQMLRPPGEELTQAYRDATRDLLFDLVVDYGVPPLLLKGVVIYLWAQEARYYYDLKHPATEYGEYPYGQSD